VRKKPYLVHGHDEVLTAARNITSDSLAPIFLTSAVTGAQRGEEAAAGQVVVWALGWVHPAGLNQHASRLSGLQRCIVYASLLCIVSWHAAVAPGLEQSHCSFFGFGG
jgi:hypothetical protein